VTVAGEGKVGGAVYAPAVEIVPTVELPPVAPFTLHVTAVFVVPDIEALNVTVVKTCTVVLTGEIVTLRGPALAIVRLNACVAV